MSNVQTIKSLLSNLTRAEKVDLLQIVIRDIGDTFPGIESNPGVCGGEACVVRTRIPVWLIEQARRLGASEADILKSYPTLTAGDLVNVWVYVNAHLPEIERQILENEEA